MYLAICSDVEHRNDGMLNLSVLPGQAIEDNLQAATYCDKAEHLQTNL